MKKELTADSQNIMVSVVMLTCNHEQYISHAIRSVLEQEASFSFEILIGDDASSDNTLGIVKEYQNKYPGIIRIVSHRENVGASRNAYDTMSASRGKYLASCEGDDYWTDRHKLQKQVDFLERHQEYIACTHPVVYVDKNEKPIPHKSLSWVSEKRVFTLKDFKGICLPGHVVSMVRRNLFLDKDFDPTIIYEAEFHIADRTQALLWLNKGDFYQLDQTMACHRVVKHGRNLTSRLYFDNTERLNRDYTYTLKLEEYAKEVLKIDAGFKYHKRTLFVKSLVLHLLHPGIYDLSVAKSILEKADNKGFYYFGIIPVATRRIAEKAGIFTKAYHLKTRKSQ